jgi:hypothetical protein
MATPRVVMMRALRGVEHAAGGAVVGPAQRPRRPGQPKTPEPPGRSVRDEAALVGKGRSGQVKAADAPGCRGYILRMDEFRARRVVDALRDRGIDGHLAKVSV